MASPGKLVVVKVGVQVAMDEEGWAVSLLSGSSGKQVLLVAHLSATLPFLLTYRIIVFFKVLS